MTRTAWLGEPGIHWAAPNKTQWITGTNLRSWFPPGWPGKCIVDFPWAQGQLQNHLGNNPCQSAFNGSALGSISFPLVWSFGGDICSSTWRRGVIIHISESWKSKSLSHVRLCDPKDYTVHRILQARILEQVGSLSLLQGIFQTQGSNPGLPHCKQILCQLSHKGSLYSHKGFNKMYPARLE